MYIHCYLSIVRRFKPIEYNNKYNYRLQWKNKLQNQMQIYLATHNARISKATLFRCARRSTSQFRLLFFQFPFLDLKWKHWMKRCMLHTHMIFNWILMLFFSSLWKFQCSNLYMSILRPCVCTNHMIIMVWVCLDFKASELLLLLYIVAFIAIFIGW